MEKKLIPKHSQKINRKYIKQHTSDKYILNNSTKILGNIKQYGPGGWFDDVKNVMKSMARTLVDKEARRAEIYDSNKYTFDLAYSEARRKGLKTFFWDNKYYNTDYSGEHHKKYEEDVKSGKAKAWEELYPNYTHPELRKAKQEELDTYGITNELTKNKTKKNETLVKIPARGYDINEAISGIIGEYNNYNNYNNALKLREDIIKKYPQFRDFYFEVVPMLGDENSYGFKYNHNDAYDYRRKLKDELTRELFESFKSDMDNRYFMNSYEQFPNTELHRDEYNMLLGYPIYYNNHDNIFRNINTPIISKYRTGKSPYYYSTKLIEESVPFISDKIKKYIDILRNFYNDYENFKRQVSDSIHSKYDKDLIKIKKEDYPDYLSYRKAFDEAEEYNNNIYPKIYEEIDLSMRKKFGKTILDYLDELYNKYMSNIDYYKNLGLYDYEGMIDILSYKDIDKLSEEDLLLLAYNGLLNAEEIDLYKNIGNNLANSRTSDYYLYGLDDYNIPGKYNKYINKGIKILGIENSPNKYNKEGIDDSKLRINSQPSLGTYTLSVPYGILSMPIKDLFFSAYDVFDVNPFGSGNDQPIILVGKPFEYYTRFYRNEPNIDSLYYNFTYKNGGYISNNSNKALASKVKKKLIKKRK